MFRDLCVNLGASAIYDFTKKLTSKETPLFILKKMGFDSSESDFPARYTEALVELRLAEKEKCVLEFFRHEDIMEVFYDYYYADEASGLRNNKMEFYSRLNKCAGILKRGDELKAANKDINEEIEEFHKIFAQKVHESRAVSEVEFYGLLKEILEETKDNNEVLNQLKSRNLEAVVNTRGEEIFNVEKMIREMGDKLSDYFETLLRQSSSQKNVVHGNISHVKNVKIGDEVHHHYPPAGKQVTQKADKIYNIEKIDKADFS